MSADRHEERIDEAAEPMERGEREMAHELEGLESDIDEAKAAAARRPEADSDLLGDVAGDWEDEATGSQQGEDAEDTEREKAPEAHDGDRSAEED